MKQFLRLLLAAGVLAFAASMMAASCGKTADPNNNNNANNNSGGSGGTGGDGNGSGGGTPQPPGPPAIAFQGFDAGAKLVAGTGGALDTIRLKASAFPTTTINMNSGSDIGRAYSAATGTLKKVFEITITGGNAGAATGGLIMVGGGNIDKVEGFADQSAGTASVASAAARKEGYSSDRARNTASANGVFPAGWNHLGIFMNNTAPTAAGADASPFAFTISGGSHPFMFCQATITTITADHPTLTGGVKITTTLAGGQTAHCYIGSKGVAFTGGVATTWLGTAASATFKKTFNIAIGGFRTDAKTVKNFIPGATDAAKITALDDGLSSADITEIIKTNPNAYKKVTVTLVSDAGF